MQNITLGNLDKFIIHNVGNKGRGDGVRFSDSFTDLSGAGDIVFKLIKNSFKFDELYHFYFEPTIDLNPMYNFVSSVFNDKDSLIEQTKNMARYLYDKSSHPQIKSGELCIFTISDCIINDEVVDCIGILKSENKEVVLKVEETKTNYDLRGVSGISSNKVDKGCLVFNSGKTNGFLVAIIDNTNKSLEAQYWKDDFLSVQPIRNEYHQTNQFLGIAKQFVTKQLDDEFDISKADKIDFLNRSVDYFKSNDQFDKEEFVKDVFADRNIINSFQKFENTYKQEMQIELNDNFEISSQAVKKQARVFKSVLKLDKNFHIYIHGSKDHIERGTDLDGRKFYKIYYENEE